MGNRLPEAVSGPFSDRVMVAAADARLDASPLLHDLARVQSIALGLEQIFKLALENDRGGETHLSPATINGLLGLGKTVSGMLVDEIDRTAIWADQRGVQVQADSLFHPATEDSSKGGA